MPKLRALRSVALVAKAGNEAAMAMSLRVEHWLKARNVEARVFLLPGDDIIPEAAPDAFFVFGGDGTVVSVARRSLGTGAAVAGFNFGRVGFLAELERDTWEQALAESLQNGLCVRPRMSLQYFLYRDQRLLHQGEVVNDVVVTRGKVARLVNLHLAVDHASFTSLRSDGLILSTPTGSTGYAGSAGGPLLPPSLNAYVVAAICPYLSSFPPLVLGPETLFSVTVGEAAPDLYLTLDGQEAYPLAGGDRLDVRGAPGRICMADFGLKSYFTRLRRVGFVQESKQAGESVGR